MKLSEIDGKNFDNGMALGIEADCEFLLVPENISLVGLLFDGDKSGMSEFLMDAIITFNLAGTHTILEIPCDAQVDPSYLMKLASNAGFSIALIPPTREEDVDQWGRLCAEFVDAFLTTPNFNRHIYPVQGYFSYLISEMLSGIEALEPSDPYVRQRFFEAIPAAWADRAKHHMRQRFSELCGGEEGIRNLASGLVAAIASEAEQIIKRDLGEPA